MFWARARAFVRMCKYYALAGVVCDVYYALLGVLIRNGAALWRNSIAQNTQRQIHNSPGCRDGGIKSQQSGMVFCESNVGVDTLTRYTYLTFKPVLSA